MHKDCIVANLRLMALAIILQYCVGFCLFVYSFVPVTVSYIVNEMFMSLFAYDLCNSDKVLVNLINHIC